MRIEKDFIGEVGIPDEAYYGSFTARAQNNFRLSRSRVHMELIRSVAKIKKCAAVVNCELGKLGNKEADAIAKAADEIVEGKLDAEFIIDAFQAGAGTPLHMNVNEVIANRAEEILGGKKGEYKRVHPNNHVNMSQSSNNAVPSAVKIACLMLSKELLDEAGSLKGTLGRKAGEFAGIMKIGRTHLQDAVPMTYGEVFSSYSRAVEKDISEIEHASRGLCELGVGGTAIGSGITAHPEFRKRIVERLCRETGLELAVSKNAFESTQNMNDFITFSNALARYATTLDRIANDLRLLGSGPVAGIGEIILPEVEPGSSIMPGKLNPSIPEAVNMVSYRILANDHAVMLCARSGQLELNFSAPLIAESLLPGIELLSNATKMFNGRCISGIKIDIEKTEKNFEESFGYATALNPYLGYSRVSALVSEAYKRKIILKELVVEKGIMGKEDLDKVIKSASGPSLVDHEIKKRIR